MTPQSLSMVPEPCGWRDKPGPQDPWPWGLCCSVCSVCRPLQQRGGGSACKFRSDPSDPSFFSDKQRCAPVHSLSTEGLRVWGILCCPTQAIHALSAAAAQRHRVLVPAGHVVCVQSTLLVNCHAPDGWLEVWASAAIAQPSEGARQWPQRKQQWPPPAWQHTEAAAGAAAPGRSCGMVRCCSAPRRG